MHNPKHSFDLSLIYMEMFTQYCKIIIGHSNEIFLHEYIYSYMRDAYDHINAPYKIEILIDVKFIEEYYVDDNKA